MALSRIFRPQLSRREFAALSCAAALSGIDLPEASATAPAEGSVCMIIRHGEKPDGSGNPPGINEKG